MKQPVEVELLGQRLTLASEQGEEHVAEVARFVDAQARQLAAEYPRVGILQVALLTALNIASECWKLGHDRADLDEAIEKLAKQVDEGLVR